MTKSPKFHPHRGLSTRSDSLYNIIGVTKDSDVDEIKKAYRKLALRLHPDKNPSEEATERFQQVNRAYAVLSDPNKRQLYDQYGGLGLMIAEQLGENNVKAYFFLQSKICKAFLTICGLLTCCYCCFCCFCCCNFCCGKYAPKFPEDDGEYTNLKEAFEKRRNSRIHDSQPTAPQNHYSPPPVFSPSPSKGSNLTKDQPATSSNSSSGHNIASANEDVRTSQPGPRTPFAAPESALPSAPHDPNVAIPLFAPSPTPGTINNNTNTANNNFNMMQPNEMTNLRHDASQYPQYTQG